MAYGTFDNTAHDKVPGEDCAVSTEVVMNKLIGLIHRVMQRRGPLEATLLLQSLHSSEWNIRSAVAITDDAPLVALIRTFVDQFEVDCGGDQVEDFRSKAKFLEWLPGMVAGPEEVRDPELDAQSRMTRLYTNTVSTVHVRKLPTCWGLFSFMFPLRAEQYLRILMGGGIWTKAEVIESFSQALIHACGRDDCVYYNWYTTADAYISSGKAVAHGINCNFHPF